MIETARLLMAGMLVLGLSVPCGARPAATGPEDPRRVIDEDAPDNDPRPPLLDPLFDPGEPDAAPDPDTENAGDDDMPVPEARYDIGALPDPVRLLRDELIAAAGTGDIEALRPLIERQTQPPAFGEHPDEDVVAYLRAISGDRDGREMLAIMVEILEAGYAHVDVGSRREAFVWPYFAVVPFDALTPPQEVELYKIITPYDRADMEVYGRYTFFRLGIAPDGQWRFFLAGD